MSELMKAQQAKVFILKFLKGPYKGKQLKLLSSEITIGRDSKCDIVFKDDSHCSRLHAKILKEGEKILIQSLNSKNPVLVNKKPIEKHLLQIKDIIQIGQTELVFLEQSKMKKSQPAFLSSKKKISKAINPARLILAFVILGALFLFFLEDPAKQKEDKQLQLTTEADILNQVEELKKQNEEESKNLSLNFKQESSRTAFISGFSTWNRIAAYRELVPTDRRC
ncbi:MAG: FHA domain-containing protein, partial [Bdellovibrionaceae bacterium]|nr:FHA domain-containing protein [Pseudobdellovibrionaceae bacterium]